MRKIAPCGSPHAGSSTCPGCRHDFDFEKQRYRTEKEMEEAALEYKKKQDSIFTGYKEVRQAKARLWNKLDTLDGE